MQKGITYRDSGVNIDAGDAFVRDIARFARATRNKYSIDTIGSFAGLLDISAGLWKQPVIVACTDGVGTKLKIAFEMNRHDTIGIDLVAMSVNDLLVTGAKPVAFLDYLATSSVDPLKHSQVIEGICKGCIASDCVLLGGETAEMPGFYQKEEYDLAGFAIGIVEKKDIYTVHNVIPGDVLIGLPSTGIHSNGYSLVRKVFENRTRFPLDGVLPGMTKKLGEELLTPTRIYSQEFSVLRNLDGVKTAAHITGGGIPGNLPRAIPEEYGLAVFQDSWPIHGIFDAVQSSGHIHRDEMYRTFNMGLGMIIIVSPESADNIQQSLKFHGFDSFLVGQVTSDSGFRWTNSKPLTAQKPFHPTMKKTSVHVMPKLAILGSGNGSNMQSICDAIDRGDLNADIACVVSNNSKAGILKRAETRSIPRYHVSAVTHPQNEAETIARILGKHKADCLVLAGYMKKIPEKVLKLFSGRVFNIHPALLPAFGGKGMFGIHVHKSVIESGARYSGVTVHRVETEYDKGEILGQRVVPVLPADTPETLATRILIEEHDLYWRILKQFL